MSNKSSFQAFVENRFFFFTSTQKNSAQTDGGDIFREVVESWQINRLTIRIFEHLQYLVKKLKKKIVNKF